MNIQKKTPYQGTKRCYGYFSCECGRTWESGNSWANSYQQCEGCSSKVYPFKQEALQKKTDSKIDKTKHHPMNLCQRCQKLGFYCGNND